MAQTPEEFGPHDRSKINLDDQHDVRYWCDVFDCTPDLLRLAVSSVGTAISDVKVYLAKGKP